MAVQNVVTNNQCSRVLLILVVNVFKYFLVSCFCFVLSHAVMVRKVTMHYINDKYRFKCKLCKGLGD